LHLPNHSPSHLPGSLQKTPYSTPLSRARANVQESPHYSRKERTPWANWLVRAPPSLIASLPGPSQHAGLSQSSHAVENRVTNGKGLTRGERGSIDFTTSWVKRVVREVRSTEYRLNPVMLSSSPGLGGSIICIQHKRAPSEPWMDETRQGRNIASHSIPNSYPHTSSCGAGRKGGLDPRWILVGSDEVAGTLSRDSREANSRPFLPSSLLLPHGQRAPLFFQEALLQRQTIVMYNSDLCPITACRWRLHFAALGALVIGGSHCCTPLRRVESHGGPPLNKSTWAMPTNWTHHRLFLSMGPSSSHPSFPPPQHHNNSILLLLALCYFSPFPIRLLLSFFLSSFRSYYSSGFLLNPFHRD